MGEGGFGRVAGGVSACQRCFHAIIEHAEWGSPAQVGEAPDSCDDCARCAARIAKVTGEVFRG